MALSGPRARGAGAIQSLEELKLSPFSGEALEAVVRADSGRILASLIGLLGGDFDLAEEAFQEACAAALESWPRDGVPARPRAWLVSAGRFRAIDRLRRVRMAAEKRPLLAAGLPRAVEPSLPPDRELVADERLKLLFTCCHPALALEARLALTLRTLCGLTAEEIARAFLVPVPTLQQRIVRAKAKIRAAAIPYRVPESETELLERLDGVLRVVYLIFNEGYAATAGAELVRADLCAEAIRLARLLDALLPERADVVGLLALCLLQDSRRAARVDRHGDLVRLADQDRSLWDARRIAEGRAQLARAVRLAPETPSPFTLQAAIAAEHARAPRAEATDWRRIAALYDALLRLEPSPVVALNRAVARAEAFGAEVGLADLAPLVGDERLAGSHLLPTVRGELLARLGLTAEAAAELERAAALAGNAPERRFLERRVAELRAQPRGPAAGSG
jgi:RNA polymerase sigma-70 factor (ECF subfamily)